MDTSRALPMTDAVAADNDPPQARFAALLDRHRGIVLKIAHGYCRDPEDRRDLVQDISAQAWRAFAGFDPARSRFSTWLYRIALNVAISQSRSAGLRHRHHASLDDEAIAALPGHDHAGAEVDAGLRALHAVIHRLDPFNRALMLLYLDERSHREIAEILGIGESNVATRLHRLRQRLREELAPTTPAARTR